MRGGVILTAFSALLAVQFLWPTTLVALIGIPLSIAAGTYTAFLFAQAKARDLWQSPLLLPQHLTQCVMAGCAVWSVAGRGAVTGLFLATLINIFLIAAEVLMPHVTAHARLAVREMTRGRYRLAFFVGLAMQIAGIVFIGAPQIAAALILIGLFAYEHAHVGAGQAVPLA